MADRIVVCFRISVARSRTADEASLLESVRFVVKRAEALGAKLGSWSSLTFSFAFDAADLEEAIELVAGEEARETLRSFAVGISQGEVVPVVEFRGVVELGRGAALRRALGLARVARPGEVVVDAEMDAVQRGDLVTRGSRVDKGPGGRVRGVLLDRAQPWRTRLERAVEALVEPPLLGRDEALDAIRAAPATLGIVRADPGLGGTRVLAALASIAASSRTLFVRPSGLGAEPLGALRRALCRSAALGGMPPLPEPERRVFDAIVAGAGSEVQAAAALVEEWLAPPRAGVAGLVLVDDAGDVDGTTLEVLAAAMLGAARAFCAVARLDAVSPLPAELAPLPPGPEVEIGPLTEQACAAVVSARARGLVASEVALALARRAAGSPLAACEALAEGLGAGDLGWDPAGISLRKRSSVRGRPLTAHEWIARRLRLLSPASRQLVCAVSAFGGDAPVAAIDAALRAAADVPVDLEREAAALRKRGWLIEPEPGWLALPTRTHAAVVAESLHEPRTIAWHRALSLVLESQAGGLGKAEAARHAALAFDGPRAARLALEAMGVARNALLEAPARVLLALARSQDPGGTEGLDDPWLDAPPGARRAGLASSASPLAASSLGAHLVERAMTRHERSSFPPLESASLVPIASPQDGRIPPPPAVPAEVSRGVDEMAARLPLLAREAIAAGDASVLERWAAEEPATEARGRLVTRLRAIVALERGEVGAALGVLREACAQARSGAPLERSRSHLAYAVGLARTGRPLEALAEGLEALARAREVADTRAEKACVGFLHKLYAANGLPELGSRWVATGETRG
jgi:hypothetical protein